MRNQLLGKNSRGFTLAEVMVSGFIMVLVVASFARASIASFNSLSNVGSRNAAHSIANDRIANFERNPNLIPGITIGQKPPETANTIQRNNGVSKRNKKIRNENGDIIGEESISKTIKNDYNVKIVYTPVSTAGTKLVDVNGNISSTSKLIRIDVTVSWEDQDSTMHNTGQIGFVRL